MKVKDKRKRKGEKKEKMTQLYNENHRSFHIDAK